MRFESFLRALDMGHCEDQQQRQALLDLALLFVAIDGEITDSETQFMKDWLSTLPWSSEVNIIEYERTALQKCLEAIENDSVENLIAHHSSLLVDQHMRDQALKLADDIANVDGHLDEEEKKAIDLLKSYLS